MNHEPFTISLENIGRRFNREWIFRNVNYSFSLGNSYAILGANGSGKSTLLQVLSGSLASSEGKMIYSIDEDVVDYADVYKHIAIAAPYMELIEEYTLGEMIDFHFKFKPYRLGSGKAQILELLGFYKAEHKLIKNFSSGMKQRLKLALACCSDTAVLMLDEPTSNLDEQGIAWYKNLIEQFSVQRLTIICSNQSHEYDFCSYQIQLSDFKP